MRTEMFQGKVLITGATGGTGGATVNELLARGHQVRALAHVEDERSRRLQDRGVEVVYGDLLDFDKVRSALHGVQRAYFVYPVRPGILEATAYFAQAAKEAGIDGLVNMSQISAREDSKSHAAAQHWFSERVFDWSGLPVAHIRPTFFAEWLLQLAPQIREGKLHVPFGTGRHAPIVDEDQGRVIAGILENPEPHKGKIYPLFGPVEYSYEDMAQVLSRVLGRKIEYEQVSFETFTAFRKGGSPKPGTPQRAGASADDFERAAKRAAENPFLFQHLREVAIDHQNGIFAGTNDNVEKLGGRPPMTLEEFITKNRAAFV